MVEPETLGSGKPAAASYQPVEGPGSVEKLPCDEKYHSVEGPGYVVRLCLDLSEWQQTD